MSRTDKVNILVVDDLPEKLLTIQTILEELDETLVIATSGEEALRRVLDQEFAVILLDVNMPRMDGFETADMIRRRKRSAHTPIIFLTAFGDEMRESRGYSLGAVDYILTPVVPEILRSKVKVFVDLFRMTQMVKRQAEEHIALAREQAARAAAEELSDRMAFLAEASRTLAGSLDPDTTARSVTRLAVPYLADLAAISLVSETGHPLGSEVAWMYGCPSPTRSCTSAASRP
jgi:CheY-like chemotaxis protein